MRWCPSMIVPSGRAFSAPGSPGRSEAISSSVVSFLNPASFGWLRDSSPCNGLSGAWLTIPVPYRWLRRAAILPRSGHLRAVDDKVVVRLQADPVLGSRAERLGQQQGGLRGDPALPSDDLVDALHWHAQVLGQRHLGEP